MCCFYRTVQMADIPVYSSYTCPRKVVDLQKCLLQCSTPTICFGAWWRANVMVRNQKRATTWEVRCRSSGSFCSRDLFQTPLSYGISNTRERLWWGQSLRLGDWISEKRPSWRPLYFLPDRRVKTKSSATLFRRHNHLCRDSQRFK